MVAGQRASQRLSDIDALTIDAYGTLLELKDVVPALDAALRERGVERTAEQILAAFRAEGEHYVPRAHEGHDEASLAALRRECAAVFLAQLDSDLDPAEFAVPYVAALEFAPLPGVEQALARLRSLGLTLVVVSNWDMSLDEHLEAIGLRYPFSGVVTSAAAGVPKPDPAIFAIALGITRTRPERTLHVGDSENDEEGAAAAGLQFAYAPLPDVVSAIA